MELNNILLDNKVSLELDFLEQLEELEYKYIEKIEKKYFKGESNE